MFEISGLKPDLVSFNERSGALVVTRGHDLAGEFMCGKGFVSSSNKGLKTGFYYGDGRIGD